MIELVKYSDYFNNHYCRPPPSLISPQAQAAFPEISQAQRVDEPTAIFAKRIIYTHPLLISHKILTGIIGL